MAPTVESIENNNVAVRTKACYNSTIFGFVTWLYNNRDVYEGYLRDEVVEQLQAVLFDTSMVQLQCQIYSNQKRQTSD